jgi:hypothetical protein
MKCSFRAIGDGARFPRVARLHGTTPHCFGAWSRAAASKRGTRHVEELAMDSLRIDELARSLLEQVPPALRAVGEDLEAGFRAVLRERLARLDLVTRDEFEAQTRVLARTRARLEALEARLAALEGEGAPES